MSVATALDGDADARQSHCHGQDGGGLQRLSQREPRHDGGGDGSQRHEQLAKLRADDDVALKQAVITYHIAHKPR